jgi:hypothetical protein
MLGYHLTDGTFDVANNEKCFWFYDVIVSAQLIQKVRKEDFQVWYLKRIKDEEFLVFGTNGNYVDDISSYPGLTQKKNDENILYKQKITYSDFRHDVFNVFLSTYDKVIYLPSEH